MQVGTDIPRALSVAGEELAAREGGVVVLRHRRRIFLSFQERVCRMLT